MFLFNGCVVWDTDKNDYFVFITTNINKSAKINIILFISFAYYLATCSSNSIFFFLMVKNS